MHTTIYSRVRSVVLNIAAIIGAICIAAVVAGMLLRISPLVVISGSMEPEIPTGALILTVERPISEVSVGDIVTVERPDGHGLITHRIESIDNTGDRTALTLKGDANSLPDPSVYTPRTVGSFLFSIPGAGHFAAYLQTGSGLLIGGSVLLAIIALAILDPQRIKRRGPGNDVPATRGPHERVEEATQTSTP